LATLSDLKKLLDDARANATPTQKPSAHNAVSGSKRPQSPGRRALEEVDLAREFADVKRLPPLARARHAPVKPVPIAHQRIADERDALLASKYGAEPTPQSWDIGQEHEGEQTFLRRGLPGDILGKLRRGHWSVQAELDLHGLNSDEARDTLADFLAESRQLHFRCVRVIHGKGLTSPNREPVLKGKVRRWLANWGDVLAYSEAPRHAGGAGAVLILLRGR